MGIKLMIILAYLIIGAIFAWLFVLSIEDIKFTDDYNKRNEKIDEITEGNPLMETAYGFVQQHYVVIGIAIIGLWPVLVAKTIEDKLKH